MWNGGQYGNNYCISDRSGLCCTCGAQYDQEQESGRISSLRRRLQALRRLSLTYCKRHF